MADRQIHLSRRVFSASSVRDTIAQTLTAIKEEDRLTYADMGRVMGKSPDRAEAWCTGDFSEMSGFSLLAAWREWNGRFIGPLRDLVEQSRPGKVSDSGTLSVLLECGARLAKALENGEIEPHEVLEARSVIEETRDALTVQLAKLGPRATAEGCKSRFCSLKAAA